MAADSETTLTSNSAGQPAVPAGAPEAPSPESPTPESPTRGAARKRRWGETATAGHGGINGRLEIGSTNLKDGAVPDN